MLVAEHDLLATVGQNVLPRYVPRGVVALVRQRVVVQPFEQFINRCDEIVIIYETAISHDAHVRAAG